MRKCMKNKADFNGKKTDTAFNNSQDNERL